MNKFIKQQLQKVNIVLPDWNDETTHFVISRNSAQKVAQAVDLSVNQQYTIKVENYILNPPPSFTLAENWNNGTKPPEECLHIIVKQTMGKMVKVLARGKDTQVMWEGWLPRKGFTIM